MDPTQNVPLAGPDTPHPFPEVAGLQAQLESATGPVKSETAAKTAEMPGSIQDASAAASQAAVSGLPPAVPPPADPATLAPATTHHLESPEVADDNDLIEQEWVNKAKEIVERTSDDPYLQNKEINKFKADYIQKRYKREIKVSEA